MQISEAPKHDHLSKGESFMGNVVAHSWRPQKMIDFLTPPTPQVYNHPKWGYPLPIMDSEHPNFGLATAPPPWSVF